MSHRHFLSGQGHKANSPVGSGASAHGHCWVSIANKTRSCPQKNRQPRVKMTKMTKSFSTNTGDYDGMAMVMIMKYHESVTTFLNPKPKVQIVCWDRCRHRTAPASLHSRPSVAPAPSTNDHLVQGGVDWNLGCPNKSVWKMNFLLDTPIFLGSIW